MMSFDALLRSERERLAKPKQIRPRGVEITESILKIVSSHDEEEDQIGDADALSPATSPLRITLTTPDVMREWLLAALYLERAPATAAIKRLLSIPSLLANAFEGSKGAEYLKGVPAAGGGEAGSQVAYCFWIGAAWEHIILEGKYLPIATNLALCYIEILKSILPLGTIGIKALPALVLLLERAGPPKLIVVAMIKLLHQEQRRSVLNQWLVAWLRECPTTAATSLAEALWALVEERLTPIDEGSDGEDDYDEESGPLGYIMRELLQCCTAGRNGSSSICSIIRRLIGSIRQHTPTQLTFLIAVLQECFIEPLANAWASEAATHNVMEDEGLSHCLLTLLTTIPFYTADVTTTEVTVSFDAADVKNSQHALCLPQKAIFDGINHHFSATNDASRKIGATVAVAYTTLAVRVAKDAKEPVEPMKFEAYPDCLPEWLSINVKADEVTQPFAQLIKAGGQLPSSSPSGKNANSDASHSMPKLGSVAVTHLLTYPLDPTQRVRLKGPFRIHKGAKEATTDAPQPFMKPFGKTRFNETPKASSTAEGSAPFVRSVQEGLRLLCGIGSKPNESEKDRATATEAALRALPSLLRAMLNGHSFSMQGALTHQRLAEKAHKQPLTISDSSSVFLLSNATAATIATRDRDEQSLHQRKGDPMAEAESALGPMVGLAITALACCDVVFPTVIQAHIDSLRLEVLTLLVAMTPLSSLQQLSVMLYHSNYSISQRVMLHHGLQGAIKLWASVPNTDSVPVQPSQTSSAELTVKKRIYPPIGDEDEEHARAMRNAREEIAARVEQRTRRWGAAVKGRKSAAELAASATAASNRKNNVSLYADAVVTAILEFYDHHERQGPSTSQAAKSIHSFSFFAEADMLYSPAELLKSIAVLFEHFYAPAGGVVMLATRTLPFLREAVKHPHTIVRAQAWMTLAQVTSQFASAVYVTQEPSAIALLQLTLQQLLPAATLVVNGGLRNESPLSKAAAAEFVNLALGLLSA